MTTVVDPLGTPAPVYNRSGTTLVNLTAGLSSVSSTSLVVGNDGVVIPNGSGHTISVVACSGSSGAYRVAATLPASCDVGDIVEVYVTGSRDGQVFPAVGDSIGARPASTGTNNAAGVGVGLVGGAIFRKVSATQWMSVGTS